MLSVLTKKKKKGGEGENLRKLLEVMTMSVTLTVVMMPWLNAYGQSH